MSTRRVKTCGKDVEIKGHLYSSARDVIEQFPTAPSPAGLSSLRPATACEILKTGGRVITDLVGAFPPASHR